MNKEDYVSLEVAKLLKEKGFDWLCDSMYANNYRVRDEILEKYPGLSDDGYQDLMKKFGGEFEENEVYGNYIEPLWIQCKNNDFYRNMYRYMIYARPTLYEAQKWLRNKHVTHIVIDFNCKGWYFRIYDIKESHCILGSENYFETYEEALNAGILETLKLI